MEDHTHQPHGSNPYQQPRPQQQKYPQQDYSLVPNQAQQTSPQQPYPPVPNQPQQQYQPPQQYQTQQPYPQQQAYAPSPIPYQAAPKKKSHAISIASFVISGFAFLILISILNNIHKMNNGVQGSGDAAAFALFLFYLPLIFISTLLAITDLAINKTKTALIALLAAVVPAVLFMLYFFTLL